MPRSASIAELRTLVAAWEPSPLARGRTAVASGVAGLDEALGGGLPAGHIVEVVSAMPGGGGGLMVGALLASTRAAGKRIALIDATDGFDPCSYRPDHLRHLVWVRARSLSEAMACTDVLVRDGNYAVTVLDLRGVPVRTMRQQPSSAWHRIRLAGEQNPGAILVLSATGCIPAVPWRFILHEGTPLNNLGRTHAERMARLTLESVRSRDAVKEEMAG